MTGDGLSKPEAIALARHIEAALDTINWEALATAHGSAAHVPNAIADLMSANPLVRSAAYWKLDNSVVLQGELYEAAPYAAAQLVRSIRVDRVPPNERTWGLLWEIGNGYADEGRMILLADGWRAPLGWASRAVMESAIDLVGPDLRSADKDTRRAAIDIMSSINWFVREAEILFNYAIDDEGDPAVRCQLEDGLRTLHEDDT